MWVMTVDQEGSRRHGDRVPELLTALDADGPLAGGPPGLVRGFERTVGDEVQAVLDDPALAVAVALHLLRRGGWSVGIGAGAVERPLPTSSRAASGSAFIRAREAVEAAKSRARSVPLAVRGDAARDAADAEAVLVLLGAVASRRTAAGWAVIDRLGTDGRRRQGEVAAELGISQQAVSGRLRTALWDEEQAARPAAARLLRAAAGAGQDDAAGAPDPADEGEDGA